MPKYRRVLARVHEWRNALRLLRLEAATKVQGQAPLKRSQPGYDQQWLAEAAVLRLKVKVMGSSLL